MSKNVLTSDLISKFQSSFSQHYSQTLAIVMKGALRFMMIGEHICTYITTYVSKDNDF